jgi:hypothetical protein
MQRLGLPILKKKSNNINKYRASLHINAAHSQKKDKIKQRVCQSNQLLAAAIAPPLMMTP